ncbi:hypothetical protein CES85_2352 [Ochrobactrum quorumnocens]|uniref:Uncharacterized protein n=1 Tax=Ochrobactrum quorumnocens TaxID=271865 RepID=A0A248UG84_9HYPH|nr:hypothetical protein CES85_2352 [[Ochrobactrum] quorumnocens]
MIRRKNPAARAAGLPVSRSERDVIVVDELAVLAFGLLRPAQEVDRLGDDLASVAVVALLVRPLRVVNAAANQNLHSLLAILLDRLAEAVEGGDAVPFRILDPVAPFVPDNLAVRVAGARGGQREVGDSGAALGGAGFGGLTDVAGENDDVLHCKSPLLLGGTIPPTRPGQGRRETPATAEPFGSLPLRPQVGRAVALARQHGWEPPGLLEETERT